MKQTAIYEVPIPQSLISVNVIEYIKTQTIISTLKKKNKCLKSCPKIQKTSQQNKLSKTMKGMIVDQKPSQNKKALIDCLFASSPKDSKEELETRIYEGVENLEFGDLSHQRSSSIQLTEINCHLKNEKTNRYSHHPEDGIREIQINFNTHHPSSPSSYEDPHRYPKNKKSCLDVSSSSLEKEASQQIEDQIHFLQSLNRLRGNLTSLHHRLKNAQFTQNHYNYKPTYAQCSPSKGMILKPKLKTSHHIKEPMSYHNHHLHYHHHHHKGSEFKKKDSFRKLGIFKHQNHLQSSGGKCSSSSGLGTFDRMSQSWLDKISRGRSKLITLNDCFLEKRLGAGRRTRKSKRILDFTPNYFRRSVEVPSSNRKMKKSFGNHARKSKRVTSRKQNLRSKAKKGGLLSKSAMKTDRNFCSRGSSKLTKHILKGKSSANKRPKRTTSRPTSSISKNCKKDKKYDRLFLKKSKEDLSTFRGLQSRQPSHTYFPNKLSDQDLFGRSGQSEVKIIKIDDLKFSKYITKKHRMSNPRMTQAKNNSTSSLKVGRGGVGSELDRAGRLATILQKSHNQHKYPRMERSKQVLVKGRPGLNFMNKSNEGKVSYRKNSLLDTKYVDSVGVDCSQFELGRSSQSHDKKGARPRSNIQKQKHDKNSTYRTRDNTFRPKKSLKTFELTSQKRNHFPIGKQFRAGGISENSTKYSSKYEGKLNLGGQEDKRKIIEFLSQNQAGIDFKCSKALQFIALKLHQFQKHKIVVKDCDMKCVKCQGKPFINKQTTKVGVC